MTVTRPKVHNIDSKILNQLLDFWNHNHPYQLKMSEMRNN